MNYVFADLETSHSNVNTLCVLEANFTLYDDRFRKLEELDRKCRIKSTVVPSIGALMTNGIKVDMLKGANQTSYNLISEIYATLKKWEPFCLIGQNFVQFDAEALIRQYYKSLIPDVYQFKKLPNKIMDTLFLARAAKLIDDNSLKCEISAKGSHLFKLESLARMNNIPHENKHSAAGDVFATVMLAKMIKERVPNLWDAGLKIAHKSDAQKFLEKNKIISHCAYFFGRARWYSVKYCYYY